jgi:hypothetical protein
MILLGLGGCGRTESSGRVPVIIFGLDDRMSGAPKGVKFDLDKARQMLAEAFDASKRLVLTEEKSAETYRAELTITLASEHEPRRTTEVGVYRAVQVDLVLYRWLGDHEQDKISSMGKAFLVQNPKKVNRQEGFALVLEQAIANSVEYIDIQLESRNLPIEGLKQLLLSDRTEDRLYVLRTLRERQNSQIVPQVIEMLSDPDADVVMEAVGVLVAQKDQRAALPLIRLARKRDQIFLLQIITALGEIQGPVARGFLFTLAAGHGSAEIRERAQEALDRILRREHASNTKPAEPAVAPPLATTDGSSPTRKGGP